MRSTVKINGYREQEVSGINSNLIESLNISSFHTVVHVVQHVRCRACKNLSEGQYLFKLSASGDFQCPYGA
jgi:hypothetical protein